MQFMLQQYSDLIVLLNIAKQKYLERDFRALEYVNIPQINIEQILYDIEFLYNVMPDCEKMAANKEDETGEYGNVCVGRIISLCDTFTLLINILNSIGYQMPPAQI